MLAGGADTGVTDDTNGEAGSEGRETTGEAGSKVSITVVEGVVGVGDVLDDNDGNNEAVDTEDTSHDDGNDVLHDSIRVGDTHRGNTDGGLGSAVSRTKV